MLRLSITLSYFFLLGTAQAQDYYTPVKKELEPLARFPLTSFSINDQSLSYELPRDLTGLPVRIEMLRSTLSTDGMRLYAGERATASCMGSDLLPACVLQHRNLPIDASALNSFVDRKYADPKMRLMAKEVATSFSSGNEPIGFISRRSEQDIPKLPRVWKTSFTGNENGKVFKTENVELIFEGMSGSFRLPDGTRGDLQNLFYDGFHISGTWQTPEASGWIDFFLASDKRTFQGTWGRMSGKPAEGEWTGQAAN